VSTTVTTTDDGWELRTRPYVNPRTGIESAEDMTITAIHRANEWVMRVDRVTPDRIPIDPAALWAAR
jgi:hypothetical protein